VKHFPHFLSRALCVLPQREVRRGPSSGDLALIVRDEKSWAGAQGLEVIPELVGSLSNRWASQWHSGGGRVLQRGFLWGVRRALGLGP
jgi:hypothetical protein